MNLFKRKASSIIIFLSILALASCGGGGGGGGGLPNPTAPSVGGGTSTVTVSPANPTAPSGTFTLTIILPDAVELYQADVEVWYDNTTVELTDKTSSTTSFAAGVLPDKFTKYYLPPPAPFDPLNPNAMASFNDAGSTWTGANGTICVISFQVSPSALSGAVTNVQLSIQYRFGITGSTIQLFNINKLITLG